MKLHYYPETDSLYIELSSAPGADSREIAEGLAADFDADGNVVGFDIDHARRGVNYGGVLTASLRRGPFTSPIASPRVRD